jgi:hypothetical protein
MSEAAEWVKRAAERIVDEWDMISESCIAHIIAEEYAKTKRRPGRHTGAPTRQPGTNITHCLCWCIDAEIPCVLAYYHDRGEWTAGQGDTQRVQRWTYLPNADTEPACPVCGEAYAGNGQVPCVECAAQAERRCVWTLVPDNTIPSVYRTSCGEVTAPNMSGDHCPHCGGRIELSEEE